MDDLKREFRSLINDVKDQNGLTQEEIAKALRMHRSTLSELLGEEKESGRGKVEQRHIDAVKSTTFPTKKNVVKSGSGPEPPDYLDNLAESNRILAEANKTLADAHYIIAANNSQLLALASGSIAGGLPIATDQPVVTALYRFVHEYLLPKKLVTPEELEKVLRSFQSADSAEVKEEGKIPVSDTLNKSNS